MVQMITRIMPEHRRLHGHRPGFFIVSNRRQRAVIGDSIIEAILFYDDHVILLRMEIGLIKIKRESGVVEAAHNVGIETRKPDAVSASVLDQGIGLSFRVGETDRVPSPAFTKNSQRLRIGRKRGMSALIIFARKSQVLPLTAVERIDPIDAVIACLLKMPLGRLFFIRALLDPAKVSFNSSAVRHIITAHAESRRYTIQIYQDVIFDTSPVAGKVYKNSENRRKQGVSCGFRCICRCSIDPIRA